MDELKGEVSKELKSESKDEHRKEEPGQGKVKTREDFILICNEMYEGRDNIFILRDGHCYFPIFKVIKKDLKKRA